MVIQRIIIKMSIESMGHFVNFLTYKITIMLFCICLLSCNKRNCDSFKYIVSDKHTCIQHIVNWNVVGSYTQQQDSLLRNDMQKGIKSIGVLNSDTIFKFRYSIPQHNKSKCVVIRELHCLISRRVFP